MAGTQGTGSSCRRGAFTVSRQAILLTCLRGPTSSSSPVSPPDVTAVLLIKGPSQHSAALPQPQPLFVPGVPFFLLSALLALLLSGCLYPLPGPHSSPFSQETPFTPVLLHGVIPLGYILAQDHQRYPFATFYFITFGAVTWVGGW